MMRRLTLLVGLVGLLGLGASSAVATPVCTTTIAVPSGGTVRASTLLTAGTCVASSDKLFGDFAVSGTITAGGSASFSFLTTPGNVTVGFDGVVPASASATLVYEVAVDPALAQGFQIDEVQADFTLNAVAAGEPASATLTASAPTTPAVAFDCTRTVNPVGGTCPEIAHFAPVSDLLLTQTITTGPNTIVTALTNTIGQTRVAEPSTLWLLGTGLLGVGWWGRRRG
jgi:hypothetical protein